jgi:hypothetical protein
MDFTSCSQNTSKGKDSFYEETLGKIRVLTVMPLVCTKLLSKSPDLAMWSLGLGGGATWRNFGDLAGELGRGVAGEALGVAGNRLGCLLAAETVPAGGHGGGGRWRCYSDELAAWPGQQAKGEAMGDPREGRGSTYWR